MGTMSCGVRMRWKRLRTECSRTSVREKTVSNVHFFQNNVAILTIPSSLCSAITVTDSRSIHIRLLVGIRSISTILTFSFSGQIEERTAMYALRVPSWFSTRYPNIYAALQHNRLHTVSSYDWQRTFEELTVPNRLQVKALQRIAFKKRPCSLLKPLSQITKNQPNCRTYSMKKSVPNRSLCLFNAIATARRCDFLRSKSTREVFSTTFHHGIVSVWSQSTPNTLRLR